jgi:hypothetical protein
MEVLVPEPSDDLSGNAAPLSFVLEPEQVAYLEAWATKHGRTISREIERRLSGTQTMDHGDPRQADWEFFDEVRSVLDDLERMTGNCWASSWERTHMAQGAVLVLMARHRHAYIAKHYGEVPSARVLSDADLDDLDLSR